MAGLIQNTIANNQPVYGAETKDYDATKRTVNSETETVAGQLHSLLSSGSPYLERAKAGSAQNANARGLLNSSMAAGAGEAAAIDAALPIATADANVYGTASRENQAFDNTAGQFNAGAVNTSNLNVAAAANQSGLQEKAGQIQSELQAQAGQIQTELQQLKGTQATSLANIEANYKDLMQTSASASAIFTQVTKNISDIMNDPNTSADQKQSAVDKQNATLQNSLSIIGAIADLDLVGLLNFSL